MSTAYHTCGGAMYCDRCYAYVLLLDDSAQDECVTAVPSGTDKAANQAAWNRGEERSPEDIAAATN